MTCIDKNKKEVMPTGCEFSFINHVNPIFYSCITGVFFGILINANQKQIITLLLPTISVLTTVHFVRTKSQKSTTI